MHGGRKRSPQFSVEIKFANQGDIVYGYAATLAPPLDNRLQFLKEEPWIIGPPTGGRKTPFPLGSAHEEARLPLDRTHKVSGIVNLWMNTWQQFHFHDTSEAAAVKRPHPSNDNLRLKAQADNLAAYLYKLRRYPAAYARIIDTTKLAAPFFGGFIARDPMPETVELA